jgi:Asp-tRNA(Asn)/Glu-tRNA(Gln) amidotransferase A subunit family amidase
MRSHLRRSPERLDRSVPFCAAIAVVLCATAAFGAEDSSFRLEEATIADVHRAILAKQLTATQLVNDYLKRIAAYGGTCVKGAVDPATGFQLGDIEPIEHAGKLNAIITLNIRGKRSKTDTADNATEMPDALEVARELDVEFARTGQLNGPLHGIPFAVKDQYDTFDMRSTSGAAANYANDRPPRDAEVVARLRKAGAIILGKANMGEYASGDRSTFGGTTCNPYDTSRSAGRSSGGCCRNRSTSCKKKPAETGPSWECEADSPAQVILARLALGRLANSFG